jgi:D-3-phosphoglycerate dehydrogenase
MERYQYRVAFTDWDVGSIDVEKEEFDRIGAELFVAQAREEGDLIRTCKEVDGLINQYSLLTRKVLKNLPKCKVVARFGVGVDSIDIRAATDLGIVVANVPDYCMDEVATQALAMMLALIRKVAFFDQKVKSGQWDFRQGRPRPPSQNLWEIKRRRWTFHVL